MGMQMVLRGWLKRTGVEDGDDTDMPPPTASVCVAVDDCDD